MIVLFRCLSCLAFLVLAFPAAAADLAHDSEKTGFALYRLMNAVPDFDRWVEHQDSYLATPGMQREAFKQKEIERLRLAFYNYDPAVDPIGNSFRVVIDMSYRDADNNPGFTMQLAKIKLKDRQFYIPSQIAGQWVSLVIPEFEKRLTVVMPPQELDDVRKLLGGNNRKDKFNGRLELDVQPLEMMSPTPVILDGVEQWLIRARIVRMNVYGRTDTLAWSYMAPDYESEQHREVLDLYKP